MDATGVLCRPPLPVRVNGGVSNPPGYRGSRLEAIPEGCSHPHGGPDLRAAIAPRIVAVFMPTYAAESNRLRPGITYRLQQAYVTDFRIG
jgi:hypothetical protein